MTDDIRAFWDRFQVGVEVAVAGGSADSLLGVRDGFVRYFQEGLENPVPVAVVPQKTEVGHGGLYLSDEATLAHARSQAADLESRLAGAYQFYVGLEGGLHVVETDGDMHYLVRCWTVVRGVLGEACGASGSVEIPPRLISGVPDSQLHAAVPGTRRSGGMISSLTYGAETRRSALSLATFHAVSTLFYGILEGRPGRSRPRRWA
jgi:non-canonical (house-cleaning) NTP pyrophosphatase